MSHHPKRVLFLDDVPGTGRRLKQTLVQFGYEVLTPETPELKFLLQKNQIQLLIHTQHKTKTHEDLCWDILDRFPFLPAIHLTTNVNAADYDLVTNQWRRTLRHLCPEKEFIQVVRRLIFFGELMTHKREYEERIHLSARADLALSAVDMNDIKSKIAEFFVSELRAENACFLDAGAMEKLTLQTSKVISIKSSELERDLHQDLIRSVYPLGAEELVSIYEGKTKALLEIPFKSHGHVLILNPTGRYVELGVHLFDDVVSKFCRHLDQMAQLSKAKDLTYIDDLTELYNQRYLGLVLDKEISRAQRAGSHFSVLFMDIDHFKKVNDTRGHVVGSKILVQVAKVLGSHIRDVDYAFRYGGDEFLVLLSGADVRTAQNIAERIRSQVESTLFTVDKHQLRITLSIGVATYPNHAQTKDQMIELADQAMYCGKHKSRNIVFVAS